MTSCMTDVHGVGCCQVNNANNALIFTKSFLKCDIFNKKFAGVKRQKHNDNLMFCYIARVVDKMINKYFLDRNYAVT